MDNVTLSLVGWVYPPWLIKCFHLENCTERGIEFEFLDRTLNILGYYNFEYIHAESRASIIDMIINGTADVAINTVRFDSKAIKQENAIDKLGMTVVVCQDKLIYWVKDTMGGTSSVVFSVCNWKICLFLLLMVVAVTTVQQCNHSSLFQVSQLSTKGTNYVWWLILGIFLGVYANLLAIALSIPPTAALPFEDLEDLSHKLKSGTCRIVVVGIEEGIPPGTGSLSTIVPNNESSVPPGIKMRLLEAYRTNPPKFVASHDDMVHEIRTKDCHIGVDYYLGHSVIQAKYCGVKWLEDEHAVENSYVIAFRKGLSDTLGYELEALLTVGAANDIYLRTIARVAIRHAAGCTVQSTTSPLILGQLYEIFSLLFVSGVLGVGLCILENLVPYINKERRKGKNKAHSGSFRNHNPL